MAKCSCIERDRQKASQLYGSMKECQDSTSINCWLLGHIRVLVVKMLFLRSYGVMDWHLFILISHCFLTIVSFNRTTTYQQQSNNISASHCQLGLIWGMCLNIFIENAAGKNILTQTETSNEIMTLNSAASKMKEYDITLWNTTLWQTDDDSGSQVSDSYQ